MQALSLKLPQSLQHGLQRKAAAMAISQSELVRRALVAYLNQDDACQGAATAAAMAQRWVGAANVTLDGQPLPADLASNPVHLEGLGQ